MKVGFIGLGIMGRPMAEHLLEKGTELIVSDVNPDAVAVFTEKGAEEGSYTKIGEQCGIVFLMVPTGAISQSILFGEGGVAYALEKGSVVCDMSSVTAECSKECYAKLKEMGIGFVDAPVSGGEGGAKAGSLAIMCGGDEEDYKKLVPYFEMMGSHSVLVGGSGAGSITKLTNQIIVVNTLAVMSEAFTFAAKAGADVEKVYNALLGGWADSNVLREKMPMIMDRNFVPGGTVAIMDKDAGNALSTAHATGAYLPYTAMTYEIFQHLTSQGYAKADQGIIVQHFEKIAGCEVSRKKD